MIGAIFLGKPWHWALLMVAASLLWLCGSKRLHVIEFNLFIIVMLLGVTASLFALVFFHRDGERITRDPLVPHDPDTDPDPPPPGD